METPYSQRILEASIEGIPLALQGIGTITKNLKAYGTGVATNGLVGVIQVAGEAQRYVQIYWHPDHIHPKPNYYKAASGLVNVAGAVVYGASSAGVLSPALGGAGAVAQGFSHYAAKLLPQDAGTYYPSLPTHNRQPKAPEEPPHQETRNPAPEPPDSPVIELRTVPDHPHTPRNSLTAPSNSAIAEAAVIRVTGYEDQEPREGAEKSVRASYENHPHARTHGNSAHHSR